jgi:hypothetical protein
MRNHLNPRLSVFVSSIPRFVSYRQVHNLHRCDNTGLVELETPN